MPAEWADMLAAHNERRKLHCACPLSWSATLAADAQAYASQCILDRHGSDGENMADATLFTTSGPVTVNTSSDDLIPVLPAESDRLAYENTWYCEHNNYLSYDNPIPVSGFTKDCGRGDNLKVNGHFTQVVWKDTRQVGCGRFTCPMTIDLKDDKGVVVKKDVPTLGTHWVCRYLPIGNSATDTATLRQEVSAPLCSTRSGSSQQQVRSVPKPSQVEMLNDMLRQ